MLLLLVSVVKCVLLPSESHQEDHAEGRGGGEDRHGGSCHHLYPFKAADIPLLLTAAEVPLPPPLSMLGVVVPQVNRGSNLSWVTINKLYIIILQYFYDRHLRQHLIKLLFSHMCWTSGRRFKLNPALNLIFVCLPKQCQVIIFVPPWDEYV